MQRSSNQFQLEFLLIQHNPLTHPPVSYLLNTLFICKVCRQASFMLHALCVQCVLYVFVRCGCTLPSLYLFIHTTPQRHVQTCVSPRPADVHLVSLSCSCWSVALQFPFSSSCTTTMIRLHIFKTIIELF